MSSTAPAAPATTAAGPVAISQEPMLWYEQLVPGSFNLPCLVRRYRGPLDTEALGWAFSELARRHAPLRTTFRLVDGRAQQVVEPHRPYALDVVDLAGLSADERDTAVSKLLADASRRPFDLAVGPLFAPSLVRLAPDDHLVVIRLHHTVFDDWSVDVFRRELSALYGAACAGLPSPLADPPTTFADFARDERAALDAGSGEAQRSWWAHELAGAPLSVQLPIGGDTPAADGGEPVRVDLPPVLATALRSLSRDLRATPYMTALAAFSVLVGRETSLDDLVLAIVVAHRNRSELEPLIGCFTKKVPVRLRLSGDPTFADLVARTRAALLGALAHQDLPFDAAIDAGLGRAGADHGVVPQISVVFQSEAPQMAGLAMPGLEVSRFDPPAESRRERHFSASPDADAAWGGGIYLGTFLILSLADTADGMRLIARGVFDRDAGRRLLEDFVDLLAGITAAPDRPVSELAPAGYGVRATQAGPPKSTIPVDDRIDLRGFRAQRSRLKAALAMCPGVAAVSLAVQCDGPGGERRLVADVVSDGHEPPTLAALRHALWSRLPGAPWPAAATGTADAEPSPTAAFLAARRGESRGDLRGDAVDARDSYWQDFSFLPLLADLRNAGWPISDEQVARNRNLETLAADIDSGAGT